MLIEIRKAYPPAQETALMEAVHVGAAGVSDAAHPSHAGRLLSRSRTASCPPQRRSRELYVHVSIDAFAGRSVDAKRALYRGIVENLGALGIPKDHVKVLLRELPRENWGIRGGQAGCDVELGFKVDV